MTLKNIRDGWLNYVKSLIDKRSLEPGFLKEVNKRANICTVCPELKITKITSDSVKGKCRKCGCTYPALIFAPKKQCPIGEWGKYEP